MSHKRVEDCPECRGKVCPEHQREIEESKTDVERAAEVLAGALRPFAEIGLWEDNYDVGSEEHADSLASDLRLDVWVRPSTVRAARAALVKYNSVKR